MRTGRIEVGFVLVMAAAAVLLATLFDLPFVLPSADGAAFVGMHYLMPLLALAGFCAASAICRNSDRGSQLMIALPCYAVVLWLHFNIKTWAPFINPNSYDAAFWAIDQRFRGVIDAAFAIRRWIGRWFGGADSLYMNGFILLFYVSFIVHSLRTPAVFRTLFLAALFFQGLGSLAYLLFPAVGPFLYEPGVNRIATDAQAYMLDARQAMLAGGSGWLTTHGSTVLLAGLGAMPSLHAGGAFLFLWFAYKYCRVLLPLYIPMFAFILIGAIANRFHYLIDLPAGIALAAGSIWLARYCTRSRAVSTEVNIVPAIA